jgi:hypothetical protein
MLHPSTKRLIDKLSEMTRKQRVAWTQGENGAVVHDTEGYRVVLTPEPHSVLLTDSLGREIETCRPEEFADELDSHARPYTKFVGELYREASRHARGTERAIQTLLAELDAVEQSPASTPEPAVIPAIGLPDATTDETAPLESETEITAAVANLADQINGAQLAAAPGPAPTAPAFAREPAVQPAPVILPTPQSQPQPGPAVVPPSEPQPATPGAVIETAAAEPMPFSDPTPRMPAPPVEVPAPSHEPGSFGTFAAFEPSATEAPAPETVMFDAPAAAPGPAIAVQPPPVAEPSSPQAEPPQATPPPAMAQPTLAGPISLSSIPFGFGLGAAQRQGAPVHPSTTAAAEPGSATAGGPPRRILIDGTLDLPDFTPESLEADAEGTYPPPAPASGPLDLPSEPASPSPEPGQPRRFNPWT